MIKRLLISSYCGYLPGQSSKTLYLYRLGPVIEHPIVATLEKIASYAHGDLSRLPGLISLVYLHLIDSYSILPYYY